LYLDYFGLSESPFSITPDPTFIYLSQRHRDALAHLLYGVGQGGSGGFVQLTGEVGTGKTTLCRALLEQVPEGTHIALILNPMMDSTELLEAICEELAVDTGGARPGGKLLVDRLTRFLLDIHRGGGRVVVVIDEAQNLSPGALEQIRLLTNLETSKEKLLQIILLGQPELRELLRRQSLRQLAQRITARYHLTPLSPADTARYVNHRLEVAGATRNPFKPAALRALYQRSHGVPRLINIIADRALVGAFAGERGQVDARLVHAAADEVQFGEPGVGARRWPRWLAAGAAAVAMLGLGWWLWAGYGPAVLSPGGPAAQPLAAATTEPAPLVEEPPPLVAVAEEPQEVQALPAAAVPGPGAPAGIPAADAGTADVLAVSGQLPGDEWLDSQSRQAWLLLAGSWGQAGDAALLEASCRGQDGLGFACIREQGNLARIRQLGLPVVLVLPGQPGMGTAEQHLFLAGLEGSAMLVGGKEDHRLVARDALEARWLGDYYAAWPQAANWPRDVQRGDTGPAVEALLRMAARADAPYQGSLQFGADFENWLKNFQTRHGLDADGIVGPRTLLYLMRFSVTEPRLLSGRYSASEEG
jgi:general secretion pathway protein A